RPLRGRRPRAGPPRPGRPRRTLPPVRRRPRRDQHPRGSRRRGARDGRRGRRALPRPQRIPGPYAAGQGCDPRCLGAPRADASAPSPRGPVGRADAVRVLNEARATSPGYTSPSIGETPVRRLVPPTAPSIRRPNARTPVSNAAPLLLVLGVALVFWVLMVR